MPNNLRHSRGNHRQLLSYRKAAIIHDGTNTFCERFYPRFDRTIDQMVQSARSGKRNIVEGSLLSRTSMQSEIKLTNAARSSLEELLEDYHDYLRNNNHPQWAINSAEALHVRKIGSSPQCSIHTFRPYYQSLPARIVANILICLILQTIHLLDRQIHRIEKEFLYLHGPGQTHYGSAPYDRKTGTTDTDPRTLPQTEKPLQWHPEAPLVPECKHLTIKSSPCIIH